MDREDVDALLHAAGFDEERSVLTRRQAEVLALRERDVPQREIAERLGTSRANVSSIEASARRNVQKARETVAVADALAEPVRVPIATGTDVFDVPETVYQACDDIGTKVTHSSAALIRKVREETPEAISEQTIVSPIVIGVSTDGSISVEHPDS